MVFLTTNVLIYQVVQLTVPYSHTLTPLKISRVYNTKNGNSQHINGPSLVQLIKKIRNTESCFTITHWEHIQLVVCALVHQCSIIQPPKALCETNIQSQWTSNCFLLTCSCFKFFFLQLVSIFFIFFISE